MRSEFISRSVSFLTICFAVTFASLSYGADEPKTEKLTPKLRQVIESHGPIVSWEPYQPLKDYLTRLADTLAHSQLRMINERAAGNRVDNVTNQIYLIDSPTENAFVLAGRGALVKGSLINRIAITTGMIKFLRQAAGEDENLFSLCLLGLLAHEMAHPVEGVQDKSISKRWKSGQGGEVLADHDATYLLREEGLPEDSLYIALKIILLTDADEDKGASWIPRPVRAALSTHPENGLRLSLQRIGLTIGRRALGQKVPVEWLPTDLKVFESADAIAGRPTKSVDLNLPNFPLGTIDEVRSAIDTFLSGGTREKDNTLLFNHLMLILAERVHKQSGAADPEFTTWTTDLIFKIISGQTPRVSYIQFIEERRSRFVLFIRPEQQVFQKLHPVPMNELLSTAPWMLDPTFVKHFREQFFARFGSDLLAAAIDPRKKEGSRLGAHLFFSSYGIDHLAKEVLLPEYFYRTFKTEWIQALDTLLDSKDKVPKYVEPDRLSSSEYGSKQPLADSKAVRQSVTALLREFPVSPRLELAVHLLKRRGSDKANVFSMVIEQDNRGNLDPFLVARLIKFLNEKEKGKSEIRKLKDSSPAELAQLIEFHFKNLNTLLFADIFLSLQIRDDYTEHFVDWEFIYELQGQQPDLQFLQSQFAEFAKSADYYEWISKTIEQLERGDEGDEKAKEHFRNNYDNTFRLSWWHVGLTEDLLGNANEKLKADPALYKRWRSHVVKQLYALDPIAFKIEAMKELQARVAAGNAPLLKDWLLEIFPYAKEYVETTLKANQPFEENGSGEAKVVVDNITAAASWYFEIVGQSKLKAKEKRGLSEIAKDWTGWVASTHAPAVWQSLGTIGKIDVPSKILKRNATLFWRDKGRFERGKDFTDAIYSYWEKPLAEELGGIKDAQTFATFVATVFGLPKKTELSQIAAHSRLVDQAIAVLNSLNLPSAERFGLFEQITRARGTVASDKYLNDVILPELNTLNVDLNRLFALVKSVKTQKVKLALVRMYFAQKGFESYGRLQSEVGIKSFLKDLNGLIPTQSAEKDEYIEKLCWDLQVNNLDRLRQLAEGKSTGRWRDANPIMVHLASALSEDFSGLSNDERWDLIEYLSSPSEMDIPKRTELYIDKRSKRGGGIYVSTKDAQRQEENTRLRLTTLIQTAKALPWPEKIPSLEFLLTNGETPWAKESLELNERWLKILNLTEGSATTQALEDYIAVVPPHEISVTAAYLLARKSENLDLSSGKLKDIFELFQVVGRKIGQGAHTWKLIEGHADLRELKDRSAPMTKLDIVTTAHEELGPELAAKIVDYTRVLAAGSIKTVTKVQLNDGSQGALETRSKYAERQVRSTLQLAMKYVTRLQQRGLVPDQRFVTNLLLRLEGQLQNELDFTRESAALPQAKLIFEKVQASLAKQLNGYRFQVPQVIEGFPATPRLLLVELASGEALDRLVPEAQAEVGPLLMRAYSRAMLIHGWIDADRSVANQLIDSSSRVISVIDLGQARQLQVESGRLMDSWRQDDRTRLLNLLLALQGNLTDRLEAAIGPMLSAESQTLWNDQTRARFQTQWAEKLTPDSGFEDRLVHLVSSLENAGLQMDERFALYALKGMLTLVAEPYADRMTQEQILAETAQDLVKEKKPIYVIQNLQQHCARLLSGSR